MLIIAASLVASCVLIPATTPDTVTPEVPKNGIIE